MTKFQLVYQNQISLNLTPKFCIYIVTLEILQGNKD